MFMGFCTYHRGDKFRRSFETCVNTRAILPAGCPVMALTATATNELVEKILDKLKINKSDVSFAAQVPDRLDNI